MGSIGDKKGEWITVPKMVLEADLQAIAVAVGRLNQNLAKAVKTILPHPGKVVVIVVGKSGHRGDKTVVSTRTCLLPR
jgi:D-arabinose 5-phosphate isomerase GutQ